MSRPFNASIADPTAFWAEAAAQAVTWTRELQRVLDDSNPQFYWGVVSRRTNLP